MESTIKFKKGQVGEQDYIPTSDNTKIKRYLDKNYTLSTITGTTSEVPVYSLLIPANTLNQQKQLRIVYSVYRDTAIGISTFKIRVNNVVAIGGVTLHSFISASNLRWMSVFNGFIYRGGFLQGRSGNQSIHDATQQTVAINLTAFDPTIDNYIILTVTNASASEITKINWVEIIN